jgi:hypothetical protein
MFFWFRKNKRKLSKTRCVSLHFASKKVKEGHPRTEFCREIRVPGQGIHRKNGIFAGNYKLLNEVSTGRMEFSQELPSPCMDEESTESMEFRQNCWLMVMDSDLQDKNSSDQ